MPARVFRFTLKNSVMGHTLDLVREHLCGGEYTPGGWTPTGTILWDNVGAVQAESDGFMTGTQGWVKYRIIRNSDAAERGLVYLYWTNPYFGATCYKHALVGRDIVADCDEEERGAGSNFADATGENAAPFGFRLNVTGIRKNGSPTDIDAVGDVYRIPLAPVWIFGAGQIWERMEIDVELVSSEIPTVLPGRGTRTRSVVTRPMPAILSGTWSGENVSVRIDRGRLPGYHVDIEDVTPGHPLELATTCHFGREGIVAMLVEQSRDLAAIVADGVAGEGMAERGRAVMALAAVSDAVRRDESTANLRPAARAQGLREAALAMAVDDSPALSAVSRAAAEAHARADHTLHPAAGLALQLFREFEDDQPRGYSLKYQRLAGDGSVIVDEFLVPRSDVN